MASFFMGLGARGAGDAVVAALAPNEGGGTLTRFTGFSPDSLSSDAFCVLDRLVDLRNTVPDAIGLAPVPFIPLAFTIARAVRKAAGPSFCRHVDPPPGQARPRAQEGRHPKRVYTTKECLYKVVNISSFLLVLNGYAQTSALQGPNLGEVLHELDFVGLGLRPSRMAHPKGSGCHGCHFIAGDSIRVQRILQASQKEKHS